MPLTEQFSRAAVFQGPGQPLRIESFPLPIPRGHEAVAKILCATVCGSDLHSFYGRRPCPSPSVLGHEMVGEIASIGPAGARDFNGNPLSLGNRVTWSMVWSCGDCYYCRRNLRPKCERLMKFGHESIAPGKALLGGFAGHCFLPQGTAIFAIPEKLPDTVASPSNCATATVAAVFRRAGNVEGQCVVVMGAGMLGLTACAMASLRGAETIVAIEPNPDRAALARNFGAHVVLDARSKLVDLRRQVFEITSGRGAAFVMEFSGAPQSVETGLQLLDFGGRLLLAGSTFPERPVALSAEEIVRRLIHIVGVYNYQPEDLACALAFLETACDRFPFASLVGASFSLDQAQEAMDFAEAARPLRVAIFPNSSNYLHD